MSYPGEYPQPLVRATNLQCPVVSGYATARLRRQDPIFCSGNVSVNDDAAQAQVLLENVSRTSFTVQLKMTNQSDSPGNDSDSVPTGTRTNVGSAVALVPGGHKTINVAPYQQFLEVYGTAGGPGFLRMQLNSQTRWDEMAFDKIDTTYPAVLRDVKPTPEAPNI